MSEPALAALLDVNAHASARFDALRAEGLDLVTSGIGPGLQEIISVRGLTESLAERIRSEFGPDVQVVEAGLSGRTTGRTDDSAPWWGGWFTQLNSIASQWNPGLS